MHETTGEGAWGALKGIRVLDLSRILAGPLCAQLLGDHGADVIKVESPDGDDTRRWGISTAPDSSSYYDSINRNKRNISLDLRDEEAREVLATLIEQSDVVIENFKPGTMKRWGFDYERDLRERHPALIYCRISGYGDDGPLGGLPGYDAALQAWSGLMSVNGEQDRPAMRIGVPMVDIATGMNAFSGILLALFERSKSGAGQFVESTLFDTSIALLHPHSGHWFASGELPVRTGGAHPSIAPYESFWTESGQIFVAAANDRQFESLCRVLGVEELASHEQYGTNAKRLQYVSQLRDLLQQRIAQWNAEALSRKLLEQGVAASPVQNVEESLSSSHAVHRQMVVAVNGQSVVGVPVKLARTPGSISNLASARGEHNSEIRRELRQSSEREDG